MFFTQNSALVIIDSQLAYRNVQNFSSYQKNIKKLLKMARQEKIPIVHVYEKDELGKSKWIPFWEELHGQKRKLDQGIPLPCTTPREDEIVIIKNGYDAFYQTNLEAVLKKYKIKTVYFSGLLTGVCVLSTVMSAFNHGFRNILIENCCSDRLKTRHQMTIQYYKNYLFKLVSI